MTERQSAMPPVDPTFGLWSGGRTVGKAGMMVGKQSSEPARAERRAPGDGHHGGIR
jgi:hypothetical protein